MPSILRVVRVRFSPAIMCNPVNAAVCASSGIFQCVCVVLERKDARGQYSRHLHSKWVDRQLENTKKKQQQHQCVGEKQKNSRYFLLRTAAVIIEPYKTLIIYFLAITYFSSCGCY